MRDHTGMTVEGEAIVPRIVFDAADGLQIGAPHGSFLPEHSASRGMDVLPE